MLMLLIGLGLIILVFVVSPIRNRRTMKNVPTSEMLAELKYRRTIKNVPTSEIVAELRRRDVPLEKEAEIAS